MSKVQTVEVIIFDTKLNLFTHDPNETLRTATELDSYIRHLSKQYPEAKPDVVQMLASLKLFIDRKKLSDENTKLTAEREELSKALQGFYV